MQSGNDSYGSCDLRFADLRGVRAAVDQKVGARGAGRAEAGAAVLTSCHVGGARRLVRRRAVAVAGVVWKLTAALADLRADPAEEVIQPRCGGAGDVAACWRARRLRNLLQTSQY